MSPRVLRRIVVLVFVSGIAGMIFGSIKDSNGFAITFGLVTAVAALGLILITSVAPPDAFRPVRPPRFRHLRMRGVPPGPDPADRAEPADPPGPRVIDETIARDVEQRVQQLVDAGADEAAVRLLVSRALDMGRSTRSRAST